MKKSLFFVTMLCFLFISSLHSQVTFSPFGTKPPDNIVSIINDPTTGDLYAAATIKVIRSTDQGATWQLTANTGVANLNMLYITAAGQLYAGADKTNGTNVGLVKYNKVADTWTLVPGSPQDITAIIEDNLGNLIIGTGTTGNYGATNPINKGSGMYYYNVAGNSWTAINTGLPNAPGYSVLPFIKCFVKTSTGTVIAGTYGCGAMQYNGSTWSTYGTGLTNNYINTLAISSSGILFAGTDAGVSMVASSSTTWATVSSGLPAAKPVRSLSLDASGTLFAGLGFYHYQNGNMTGDLYSSTNNGTSWQNASTGYVGGVIYCVLAHPSGKLFAGSAGIWKSLNSGGSWAYSMMGVSISNQVIKIAKNSAGDIFVMCRNILLGYRLPYAGVFRSTDNGLTWTQLVNGIKAQGLNELFIDSQDNIWLSGGILKSNANGTGTIWGTPELYKSTNNGNTWVQNTSIVAASTSYDYIKETNSGKLYVASSFGTALTNISSTVDYNTFDNTLNLPPNNGYHSYGLAVNNANDVFHGTESNGMMRSISNGAPGTFSSITTGATYTASTPCPIGNVGAFVDPYSQYVFGTGTNGTTTGIRFYGSTNTNNGTNMFPFLNFPPTWTAVADLAFSNTGKMYTYVQSSQFNQVGLYETQGPFNTNSTFTKAISSGTLSYYFNTLYIDKCGYLYGTSSGNGISISNGHVNTPSASTLSLPANNSTGVSLTPTLTWSANCSADSSRLQVSTTSAFTAITLDVQQITGNNYTVSPGIFNLNTTYYWRVYGANNKGTGSWSTTYNFTTALTTGINNVNELSDFLIYPNPTSDIVTIRFNDDARTQQVRIYDLTGRLIEQIECKEQIKIISTKGWSQGVYVIKCGNYVQKIVKN
ncbi:MAG: T9SS type A sorting domain-containing protein [Bacteroidetes bacterium]|nr:T9SS type A sorting domain-containing protein [Bacteroidota bacterium]